MGAETTFSFSCSGRPLCGVLHSGDPNARRGVLVIVGGPQYRAGSHRQFVLLARFLAARGIPVMRFDSGGMGDAAGPLLDFTGLDQDIAAAMDALQAREPQVNEVVLWGLCDAASAALFYAWQDSRVAGLVLLNPWVRTEAGAARTWLRHYYLQRLFSRAFWSKLLRGGIAWMSSMRDLAGRLTHVAGGGGNSNRCGTDMTNMPLPERMAEGLERFHSPVLCILSGNDLTAAEFRDLVQGSPRWSRLLQGEQVQRVDLEAADHTFSRREWRDEVARCTADWVQAL